LADVRVDAHTECAGAASQARMAGFQPDFVEVSVARLLKCALVRRDSLRPNISTLR
jgi:hypothetical protein